MDEPKITSEMKNFFRAEAFEKCLAHADHVIERFPDSHLGYQFKSLSLLALGRFEEGLPVAQKAICMASPKIYGDLWRRVVKAHLMAGLKRTEVAAYWDGCNSTYEVVLDDSRKNLLRGAFDDAMSDLDRLGDGLFSRENQEKLIRGLGIISGHIAPTLDGEQAKAAIVMPKIVFAAGMGWSGSSAIFDYLSEFDKVVPVKWESPFISRGVYSLDSIERSLYGDPTHLRAQVINFLFYNLLGFSRIKQGADLKNFNAARLLSTGNNRNAHFDAIVDYCSVASLLMAETFPEKKRDIFSVMVKLVLGKFAIPYEIPEGSIVLMDNAVKISKLSVVRFLENSVFYCCFRDPRANYVAQIRENLQFHQDVETFVKKRGQALVKLVETVERYSARQDLHCEVHKVQFEEFVLSESYRDRMAEHLGLRLDERAKHSKFKPWESMRNVVIHQEHRDQSEIRFIESKLGAYCYEPCLRPFLTDPTG